MKGRCHNPNNKNYNDYGGRGITVCHRWQKFENFLADMGKRPVDMTLDRVDNNGNYSPENCQWATRAQQSNNKRCVQLFVHNNQAKSLAQWARLCGINTTTLQSRLKNGWSFELAISTPVR